MVVVVVVVAAEIVVMVTAAREGMGVAVQEYYVSVPARGLAYIFKLDVGTAA